MSAFPDIFYPAAILAAVGALMAVCIRWRTYQYAAVSTLIGPILLVYLLGMYRVGGPDFDNYVSYLGSGRDRVPDVGYRFLMEVANVFGLSLTEFFLLQGLFSLGAVYALARKLRSEFVVTITLYIVHGAIVRDFSQSRVGLALAIYFLALAQDKRIPYVALTVAALSVHLSLLPLVIIYHWARIAVGSRAQFLLVTVPAAVVIASAAFALPLLALLDPRIEIYMNWAEDFYGNPVSSFASLLLTVPMAAICYQAYRVTGDRDLKILLIVILYAAVIFIAFRQFAIFSFRLANVVLALYPFAVGRAIALLRDREQNRLHDFALTLVLLGVLMGAVFLRPGSLGTLGLTQPALLVY